MDAISPKIYIVDDDDAVRESMRALFESYGYQVEEYASGPAFLANYIPDPRPAGLVLDMHQPRMLGTEIVAELRQGTGQGLPILLITGLGGKVTRERALAAGATAFLEKPVDGDRLIAMVDEMMTRFDPAQTAATATR